MTHKHSHHRRNYYLVDIPLDEAIERFFASLEASNALEPMQSENVSIDQALGRVTGTPVWAKTSSPHYHAAAMDGIAVRSENTVGATETSPLKLKLGDQVVWVNTGDPLPQNCDAVVMLEFIHQSDALTVEIQSSVTPWQHVRPLGEDIVATELVLPENHILRPVDVGAIAACGLTQARVRRKPSVAIIPTGSELVQPGSKLEPGDIVEYNSLMLAGQVKDWGGDATRYPITPDDYDMIKAIVEKTINEHDVVIINAGSSAGSQDYTAAIVRDLGELLVHGIAIRPGHPVVLGLAKGTPILGIPGYPASAVITSELLLRPLLEQKLGLGHIKPPVIEATMTRKVLSPIGEDEFLRVKLGRVGGKIMATPLQRGAGIIMSLVRADGLALIPRYSEGIHAGGSVKVELLRSTDEIDNTIVIMGSHDLTLDLLASYLRRDHPKMSLSSSNIGSIGGLISLRRGEAHIAGTHLLNEDTGEYNLPYIAQHCKGESVVLVNLTHRIQGLIVQNRNPKGIESLEHLTRDDILFSNRQRGSGTRVLLDFKLRQLGINPTTVRGYEREQFTHLAVAADVASGTCDVGLGILGAAKALDLDFIPLLNERYDLAIPRTYYDSSLLEPLLKIIQGDEFRREVSSIGGYDVSQMGQVMGEID